MKRLNLLIFLVLLLTGCANAKENDEKDEWFNSEKKAIDYGIQDENISKNDILEKVDLDGEKVIVFRFTTLDGKGICIARIIHKNNKYQWYRDLNQVVLKSSKPNIGNLDVSTDFKTHKGKKYKLYLGVADKPNFTFETAENIEITPKIDEKTNMYYYIMPE